MLVITVILSKLKEGEEDTEGGGKQAAEHEISTLHKAYLLFYMPIATLNAWRACTYEISRCSVIIIQPLPPAHLSHLWSHRRNQTGYTHTPNYTVLFLFCLRNYR